MSSGREAARISAKDWETYYRKYYRALGTYFASQGLGPDDVEDLDQEIFRELGQSKVPEHPNAYLYAIAKNVLARHRRRQIAERAALDEYRRYVTIRDVHLVEPALDAGRPEEDPTTTAQHILRTVAARLPPRDVAVMALRLIEGLPVRQLAQRMGCSENAVSKRMEKIRALLRGLNRE